jgi:hypothetical protein
VVDEKPAEDQPSEQAASSESSDEVISQISELMKQPDTSDVDGIEEPVSDYSDDDEDEDVDD